MPRVGGPHPYVAARATIWTGTNPKAARRAQDGAVSRARRGPLIVPDDEVEHSHEPKPSPLEASASAGDWQRRSLERWVTWL